MDCKVSVTAHHGDYSGVDELIITTDERLSKSNLPDLKAANKYLDGRCTESWANISMTGDNEWWPTEDEDIGCDDCDYKGCDKCEEVKGIEVRFTSDYGGLDSKYASYYAIEQELLNTLKLGQYTKTETYDGKGGCDTEYVYHLSEKIFK